MAASLGSFTFDSDPFAGSSPAAAAPSGSSSSGGFFSNLFGNVPAASEILGAFATAGLERAVSSINRPAGSVSSPEGRLGKVGTVGLEVGLSPQVKTTLLVGGAALLLVVLYFATRGGK